jgi:hypothetical protein
MKLLGIRMADLNRRNTPEEEVSSVFKKKMGTEGWGSHAKELVWWLIACLVVAAALFGFHAPVRRTCKTRSRQLLSS